MKNEKRPPIGGLFYLKDYKYRGTQNGIKRHFQND